MKIRALVNVKERTVCSVFVPDVMLSKQVNTAPDLVVRRKDLSSAPHKLSYYKGAMYCKPDNLLVQLSDENRMGFASTGIYIYTLLPFKEVMLLVWFSTRLYTAH